MTYFQEQLPFFLSCSDSTEQLLYNSSTWLPEHRCLLYRWRSWLDHKFCLGAENKPTFPKLPPRAFFLLLSSASWCAPALTWMNKMIPAFLWVGNSHAEGYQPQGFCLDRDTRANRSVFPSFLLHAIGIWSGHSRSCIAEISCTSFTHMDFSTSNKKNASLNAH